MKMSRAEFLISHLSGELFLGTGSKEQYFGRFMTIYNRGKLQPLDVKGNKEIKYKAIDNK